MSDSNWRQFLKDRGGLIASFSFAAIFAIVFLSLAHGWQRDADYEASSAAKNYARNANDQIRAECGLSPTSRPNKCANEANDAARKNQREEYDLAAQRSMAIWTAVMGWMAVIGIGLSGVGVYLIWRTWKESARAADSATNTYQAYLSVERGMLDPVCLKIIRDKELPSWLQIHVHFRNVGRSPCLLKEMRHGLSTDDFWHDRSAFQLANPGEIIEPDKERGAKGLMLDWGFSLDELYVIGTLTYETLGETYKTPFAYKVIANYANPDFTEWEPHGVSIKGMPEKT